MGPVLISLVITTYNRAALLRKALDSVARSQIADHESVEVVIVDNNSTDNTLQTVDEARMRGFPFTLRYVQEPRQGISWARNRGAEEAKGTYVAYMDDDQLIDQYYLSKIEAIFRDTHAMCVGGPVFYYCKDKLPGWVSPLLETAGQIWYGPERKVLGGADGKLGTGNMVFNRRELMDFGRFDVTLGRVGDSLMGGEDDELQDRLHAAGKKVVYAPELIQHHYLAPVRLTKRYWRRHHFDYGRTLYRMNWSNSDSPRSAAFLGAPNWLWRLLVTRDIPQALAPLLRLDFKGGFYRQLDVFICLGQIHEARQQSIRGKG